MPIQPPHVANISVLVEPGDCQISSEPACRLASRGIRSSVVVAILVPTLSLAGLTRYRFPQEAESSLWNLLSLMRERGGTASKLHLYAAGGASLPEGAGERTCGKANQLALKKVLWRERLWLSGEDLGGDLVRSVSLEPKAGRLLVCSEKQLMAFETQPLRHAI